MTDQAKKPSWETLAQELGAEVTSPPQRPRVEPTKPAVPPSVAGTPAPPPATPVEPKKRGWDDVAAWLGLGGVMKRSRPEATAPLPTPVPLKPSVPLMPPAAPPVAASEANVVEPPRRESREEPRRGRRDERRDQRRPEPRPQSESRHPESRPPRRDDDRPPMAPPAGQDVDDELAIDRPEGSHAARPAEGEDGGAGRPRRRRRRRGGRGRNRDGAPTDANRGGEPREPRDSRGPADEAPGLVDSARDEADYEHQEVEPAPIDGEVRIPDEERNGAAREGDGEPRPRRRRRRRGRGGRDRERPVAEPRSTTDAEPLVDDDDVLDVDEESITRERIRAEGISEELDEPHDDEVGDEGHLMHRGIPTWEEAIGMIVNVNLEARAKHPHSSSGHHRGGGGGGRGRGRGGRGDRR